MLGCWHQKPDDRFGNRPQGNEKPLVVKDKNEGPRVS